MRKLDAALAETLGYEVREIQGEYILPMGQRDISFPEEVPYYSEDGNAMIELDAEMRGREWLLTVSQSNSGGAWKAEYMLAEIKYGASNYDFAIADTMPKAVALAAYKALTGKGWTDE